MLVAVAGNRSSRYHVYVVWIICHAYAKRNNTFYSAKACPINVLEAI